MLVVIFDYIGVHIWILLKTVWIAKSGIQCEFWIIYDGIKNEKKSMQSETLYTVSLFFSIFYKASSMT